MDVLIKGLPLPQEGEYDYHLTIRSDGKVEGTQQVGERIHSIHTWAIELPPHGRCIDVDRLPVSTLIYNQANGLEIESLELKLVYLKDLHNAPTVLEESK